MNSSTLGLLRQPRIIVMGRGQRHSLVSHLPANVQRALVVTDARMAGQPAFAEMIHQLREADISTTIVSDIQPELPANDALLAVEKIGHVKIDVIIGIGGGSCMDFAKVVAVLLTHGGKPQDYYGEFAVPGPAVPVVAVPTTAGTGSEATPVAVLTDPDREMKIGISSPFLVPYLAICDPELTDEAPRALTAASGTDALSHSIESFTAIRRDPTPTLAAERVFIGKSLFTDHYALAGIKAVGRSLRIASNGDNCSGRMQAARDDMVFAAIAGGLALGTGGTAAAHALQYPVGAATHTAHGVGVGVLLPFVMEFNRISRVSEFAEMARAFGIDSNSSSDEDLSHLVIEYVAELLTEIGIPSTLAQLGMPPGRERWLAEKAMNASRLIENNPRPLDIESLETIAAAAYRGDRKLLASSSDSASPVTHI